MSVFYWGEQPAGTWTLEIENTGSNYNSGEKMLFLPVLDLKSLNASDYTLVLLYIDNTKT